MFISIDAFRSLLASNPIIIFDTNIYLDLLRYSKNASSDLLKLYRTVTGDLVATPQIAKEFRRNLPVVCGVRLTNLRKSKTDIINAVDKCRAAIDSQISIFSKYKFTGVEKFKTDTQGKLDEIKDSIDKFSAEITGADSFIVEQEASAFFEQVMGNSDKHDYTQSQLLEIIQKGEVRYRYKIPPGYMDDPKINKDSCKEGVDIFGDLIIWFQIIDCAREQSRPVVFVTSDTKEDWFINSKNQPKEPRKELISEFNEETGGGNICILPREIFIEYLSSIKRVDTFEILLEMQMDNYTDWVITNYKPLILHSLLEWANIDSHILQFPFIKTVNNLLNIENERFVIKSSSFQINTAIEYVVTIEGVANFFAGWKQDKEDYNINNYEWKTFYFELSITFSRPFLTNDSGKREAKKNVENIRVLGAVFEATPTSDMQLESKRGIFAVPNDQDKEIFEYMDKLWAEYELKYDSSVMAERDALIETAKHFNKSLVETYRSYRLAQPSKSKYVFSLNEIDALTRKRFESMKLQIDSGEAILEDDRIPVGDCYPLPESMKVLPPEQGKELNVTFSVITEYTTDGRIICSGITNLPKDTVLMLSLKGQEFDYYDNSHLEILSDGTFVSDAFANNKNPLANAMPHGKYVISISMPVLDLQPEEVRAIIGKRGRNLVGKYSKDDFIYGRSIDYCIELDV